MNYTAKNAVLPAKNILTASRSSARCCSSPTSWRRTWMLPGVGLALLVLSSILLGMIWPAIVQQFQVKPSEADKEAPYIRRTSTPPARPTGSAASSTTAPRADRDRRSRPQREVCPGAGGRPRAGRATFEQRQQVRGYYSVAPVLDVDRYTVDGRDRRWCSACASSTRTDHPSDQNWSNLHTDLHARLRRDRGVRQPDGAADDPPTTTDRVGREPRADEDELSDGHRRYEGRIYFGEKSPDYYIVGKANDGEEDVELDLGSTSAADRTTTYDGSSGVPIGGLFNKLLYAVKFGEPNIVLSSRVNENSKILYHREPAERVEKVAPWLTLDPTPTRRSWTARCVWILDGYTTTDRYPNSQRESFEEMIDDSLQHQHRLPDAADRRDQLHAQRREGDRRRLRRHGQPLRVGRGGPDPQGVDKRLPRHGAGQVGDPRGAGRAHALSRGPVQGAALPARGVPRHRRRRLLPGHDQWEVPEDPNASS